MIKIRPFGEEPPTIGSIPAIKFNCELCDESMVESGSYTFNVHSVADGCANHTGIKFRFM
ncbi:MAG: hypothetical protein QXX41_14055 [Nitrososphaerota archaeon]